MWSKDIIDWTEDKNAFISVVFTWDLPKAYSRAIWYRQLGYSVKVGGTATILMPNYLSEFETGEMAGVLLRHNSEATRTSLGCPHNCSFCGVNTIEPVFKELPTWEIKPIICDNNLTACSHRHFDRVVDSLKPIKGIDINQGLDARLFKKWHLDRLQELSLYKLRFAWDNIREEGQIMATLEMVIKSGFPRSKIHVYVLFNHGDTPQDALYRCETLWNMGIVPNVQRYQPTDCLVKNSYIDPCWNNPFLREFTLFWSRRHLKLEAHRILRLKKLMDFIRGENNNVTTGAMK